MSGFKKKRESLELFVKEQIIGPGAFNKRYFFIEKLEANEYKGLDIKAISVRAFDNKSEVLTEVPAYQYSSAILFPETRTKLPKGTVAKPTSIPTSDENADDNDKDEAKGEITGADDDDIKDDSAESLVSKQQNYPNSLGLSFVVSRDTDLQKDILVSVSFRKYFNVKKEACLANKLSCLVTEYGAEIERAITKYYATIFSVVRKDKNLFVTINSIISNDDLYLIDYQYTNNFIREEVLPVIKDVFRDSIVELKEKNGIKYFGFLEGVKTYEIYSISESNKYGFFNVVTLFDERIISYLQLQLNLGLANYVNFKDLIQTIEIYNQIKNYVADLKSVYKPKNASPVWESIPYDNILLALPVFEGEGHVFRSKELLVDAENKEISDLKYYVQYIRKNDEIFVKIILLNKGSILLKENEPPQLNKKDEANKKAFFGVKILVEEKKEKQLKQYNPPQLLDFDEEDNFNKLLYRNYHDFGEGYNTSVDWGKNNANLNYISTEFLPEQETPKVDFKPSKIVAGKIISRLNVKSESVLSMQYLSSLSNSSDEDVLEGLIEFVNEYKIWIDEKRNELKGESGLNTDQADLLSKQLLACQNDYNRLIRNITLLSTDSQAIAAFRMMNTAMFMQLHHSILKKNKDEILNTELTEQYYKGVNADYKWRSFQIAFILLNIDAFVKPGIDDKTVENVFSKGWPERNEIADLVWFPTGGGKTEAYLGIIAFVISYRRFTKGLMGNGTTVLMRYTLRLLTLQQFQRATLLICALEVIRKDKYTIPHNCNLGEERISIGLFVGGNSLPNKWEDSGSPDDKSMEKELQKISNSIKQYEEKLKIAKAKGDNISQIEKIIKTNLPFTDCPWCGNDLFISGNLSNVATSSSRGQFVYGIEDRVNICCNNNSCAYKGSGNQNRPSNKTSLPFRLFDEDIYKFPPTLLFGTVDKFAALANNVSSIAAGRNKDSKRLFGRGHNQNSLPPELIIQDELHLLLGPLGSAVGLFEKSIDYLCTYEENGLKIRPKIVTSTATTRNTDKQIFALFNRRSEIFPKQGILSDDSFFAYYERNENKIDEYLANRKYIGILPVGKTQVWMQLRIASIALAHRLKYLKECFTNNEIFETPDALADYVNVFDYYHTILSYFNSLKDVGKTQSQLSHHLPGDVNFVVKNTIPWSFLDKLIRDESKIDYSELTGRLNGEEVKSNLSNIEKKWKLFTDEDDKTILNFNTPPEFVISTNMISVGIDVSRFNTMIISSMPRNIAEYIQASSRVARSVEGIVFTVHHPFRSRDISHYQKFKEFHEKFYSYVEPISVTPFASKAMDRYLAMFISVMIRHNATLGLMNNTDASLIDDSKIKLIKKMINDEIVEVKNNAKVLNEYLKSRPAGVVSSIDGIITDDELIDLNNKLENLLNNWISRLTGSEPPSDLSFRLRDRINESLFISASDDNYSKHWKVGYSLREIDPSVVIKTVQQ
jgi:hypothetical protein